MKLSDRVNWLTPLQTICDDTRLNSYSSVCVLVRVCVCVCVNSGSLDCTPPKPSALADSHRCVNVK